MIITSLSLLVFRRFVVGPGCVMVLLLPQLDFFNCNKLKRNIMHTPSVSVSVCLSLCLCLSVSHYNNVLIDRLISQWINLIFIYQLTFSHCSFVVCLSF